MKSFFLIIAFLVSVNLSAQDLRQEILSYQDSSRLLIENSRKLIVSNLDEWNIKKVTEIKNYLEEEIDPERYQSFNLGEELLLDLLIADFRRPLVISQYWDSLSVKYYGYPPVEDNLFNILIKTTIDNKDRVVNNIEEIVVSKEQEDFLFLLLEALIAVDPAQGISQEELNNKSKAYIDEYEYSPYNNFIIKNILLEYEPAPLGLGIYMGAGWVNLSENTADYIDPYTPVFMGIDVLYKRWLFSLKLIGGGGGITKPFQWKGNDYQADQFRLNPFLGGFGMGFDVIHSKRVHLYPTGFIGGFGVTPVDDEEGDLDLSSFTYGFGGILDIVLWNWTSRGNYYNPAVFLNNEVGLKFFYEHLFYEFEDTAPVFEGTYQAYGITLYWVFRSQRVKKY